MPGAITIEDLQIVSSANADRLKESPVVVTAAERVLILGAPGTGKTQLFRALAGTLALGRRADHPASTASRSSTCRGARRTCREGRCGRCSPIR